VRLEFVLASMGAFGPLDDAVTVVFEEVAGLVAVAIERREEGRIWCDLQAPQSPSWCACSQASVSPVH
jgi:hypothetical protein